MSREINLLEKQIRKVGKKIKIRKLIIRVMLLVLLGLSGLMIILSLVSIGLAKANEELDVKISADKKKIEALSETESKQVYLTDKLRSFESLLITHEKHQALTETVFALIPNGTNLKGFEVNEDGIILLNGSVPDFATLEELIKRIKDSDKYRLPLLSAKVNRVSFALEGGVSFDIEIEIGINQGVET